jgi:hypothetical protein
MRTWHRKWPGRLLATQVSNPEDSESSAAAVPYCPSILGVPLLALGEPLLTRVRVVGFEGGATSTISNPEVVLMEGLNQLKGLARMVARDGVEPPTPAFSGLRSTT